MFANKTVFIILGITFAVLTGILGGYLVYRFSTRSAPTSEVKPTPSPVVELSTWTDQAEFTFQYPKTLKLNSHDEDEENYAHVELTSSSNPGNLIIWVKDTKAKDIDEWAKGTKGTIDSTIDGIPAKKVLTNSDATLIMAAIRNGYLYEIQVSLEDKEYWQKIFNTVYSSFKFTQTEATITNTKKTEDETVQDSPAARSNQDATDTSGDLGEEVIE